MAGHGIVFQRRLYFRSRAVGSHSHIGDTGNQPNFVPEGNGSSLQFLYQQSQELFADIAIEGERPVPERYPTADTVGSGPLRAVWLFGSCIESHRIAAGAL